MKPLGLVLAGLLALTACSVAGPAAERPAPAPSTTPSTTPSAVAETDLDAIVDDPEARITAVTVRRSDPSVRSVVWSLCRTPQCRRFDEVVAVTDDGFATRHLQALTSQTLATPLDGVFLLTRRRGSEILQPDGSRTAVDWDAGPAGPLSASEHPVGVHRFGRIHAVDPTTGAGHLVPTPAGTRGLATEAPARLRLYVGGGSRMLSSYDGGRTWDERAAFAAPRGMLVQGIGSSTSTTAVVTGGDGATVLPVGSLHRWDGERWREFAGPDDPTAYLGNGGGAVLADGGLLLSLETWSDERRNRPSSRPAGLWRSDGRDWAALRPVPLGAPFDTLDLRRDSSPILDVAVAPRRVTVYAVHDAPAGRTLWSSRDAGRTWTEVAAR